MDLIGIKDFLIRIEDGVSGRGQGLRIFKVTG